MELEQVLLEFHKTIQVLQQGQWIPLAVVSFLLLIIFGLLRYIYIRDRAYSNKRHDQAEELINSIATLSKENQTMIRLHEQEIEHLKGA